MCALDASLDVFSSANLSHSSILEANHLSTEPNPVSSTLFLITEYGITHKQASESAWVFFIEDAETHKPMVAKVLRQYSDCRYDLSDVAKRQRCQLEALRHNRYFTPEVYIGLAKLHSLSIEEKRIILGSIIEHPVAEDLEPDAEYALIMERLPDEFRLDQLLKDDSSSFPYLLKYLTGHIVDLQKFHTPPLSVQECAYRGSYTNLKSKLEENLAFFLQLQNEADPDLHETIVRICEELRKVFTEERFAGILEKRVRAGAIKHCHGDIKALNIWIVLGDEPGGLSVKLLDAIDFNPLFNYIDILSDFAMLVIDVWVRTQPSRFALDMIEDYFEQVEQNDPDTRMLFTYYLVEKAIVAATINILFDNQPDLGERLLKLAQEHLLRLLEKELYQYV